MLSSSYTQPVLNESERRKRKSYIYEDAPKRGRKKTEINLFFLEKGRRLETWEGDLL
jgi:hypothetical protein